MLRRTELRALDPRSKFEVIEGREITFFERPERTLGTSQRCGSFHLVGYYTSDRTFKDAGTQLIGQFLVAEKLDDKWHTFMSGC